ncbi:type II toxin-antitoxin system RelE/ParE family toxin [Rhizobium sp. NRK18]|uniref:type II toxin-antitoxin system RelE/ParE family toxin n=1 Tax=Rhizobium sp. NRK18 TaxID=2964667 RepID=UPI0021C49747|nr:type II toxin-antitoxin system RelE/ParE family toxin [Rhizobium sp. NRK18]MCQ2003437.1 type II toxin-antitoxin system RelE/ParE family toxin [Rhizobium sp. NRK18]
MKVRVSRLAALDLISIGDHLSEQAGKRRAREFLIELRKKCAELGHMAERFVALEGFQDAGLRRRVSRNYVIIYRANADVVEILRIFHGAMDYENLLDVRQTFDDDTN